MTTIESKSVELNVSAQKVFDFLSDFNNFEKLMPKDKINNWASTNEVCSFDISGMASIGMRINQTTPHSAINIVSHGKNPFEFTLDVKIEEVAEDKSAVQLIFNGKINPFVKMMVEKPLGNFFNMLADKLAEIKFQ